jgi:uncharacterized protein YifN (PemK superfamily)
MALIFHPEPGMVLICDYNTGFRAPEMVKRRPVVVISPRPRRKTMLCTVVPLSTTAPNPIEPHHYKISPDSLPGNLAENETWAKCDMLSAVSLSRLDRVKIRMPDGRREYVAKRVTDADLVEIQRAVLCGLGLFDLTQHV